MTDALVAQSIAEDGAMIPLLRRMSSTIFKYPGSWPRQSDRVVIKAWVTMRVQGEEILAGHEYRNDYGKIDA